MTALGDDRHDATPLTSVATTDRPATRTDLRSGSSSTSPTVSRADRPGRALRRSSPRIRVTSSRGENGLVR